MGLLFNVLVVAPPLLIAVILHEIAHGWVAEKLGDNTARRLGRITLNPLKHIDPYMTLMLPGLLILLGSPIVFGGAKPVPVNPFEMKNPRKDMVWVAIAGPIVNFTLACISWLLFRQLTKLDALPVFAAAVVFLLNHWLVYSVVINVVLGSFNLIPIPPLDGGRIAVGLLPMSLARPLARLERFGMLIVIALLFSGVLEKVLAPLLNITLGRLLQ